jgi:fatty-acyl-CoA synthase
MSDQGHYSTGLDKTPANFVPLSPLSFLERSATVYPNLTSAARTAAR